MNWIYSFVILLFYVWIGICYEDGTLIQIWNCIPNSPHQKWYFSTDGTNEIRLKVRLNIKTFQVDQKCLDISNWDQENGAVVNLWFLILKLSHCSFKGMSSY